MITLIFGNKKIEIQPDKVVKSLIEMNITDIEATSTWHFTLDQPQTMTLITALKETVQKVK